MSKLVAYFSASGVTEKLAKDLATAVGADTYKIKPETPYTDADLNYMDKNSRSSVEMGDKSFRPPIVTGDIDITGYDTVYLGFPVWWFTAPTIINTFLEAYDFSGKQIVLFGTSGSTGFGSALDDLKPSAPGADIKEGKIFSGGRATSEDLAAIM